MGLWLHCQGFIPNNSGILRLLEPIIKTKRNSRNGSGAYGRFIILYSKTIPKLWGNWCTAALNFSSSNFVGRGEPKDLPAPPVSREEGELRRLYRRTPHVSFSCLGLSRQMSSLVSGNCWNAQSEWSPWKMPAPVCTEIWWVSTLDAHRMEVYLNRLSVLVDSSAWRGYRNSVYPDILGTIPQCGRVANKYSRFLNYQLCKVSKIGKKTMQHRSRSWYRFFQCYPCCCEMGGFIVKYDRSGIYWYVSGAPGQGRASCEFDSVLLPGPGLKVLPIPSTVYPRVMFPPVWLNLYRTTWIKQCTRPGINRTLLHKRLSFRLGLTSKPLKNVWLENYH